MYLISPQQRPHRESPTSIPTIIPWLSSALLCRIGIRGSWSRFRAARRGQQPWLDVSDGRRNGISVGE